MRVMFAEKYSAQEIADAIGTTMNAVIGKCHRLGLTREKLRPRFHSTRKKPEMRVASPPTAPAEIHDLPLMRRRIVTPESRPGAVSLFDLETDQCRWPTVDGPPILFCGDPTVDGVSYCGRHARAAYAGRPQIRRPYYHY